MKRPTIKPFGDQAVLIEWKPSIDNTTLTIVLQVKQLILKTFTKEVLITTQQH